LGLKTAPNLPPLKGLDDAPPAEGSLPYSESPARLVYSEHPLLKNLSSGLRRRPFLRYDYGAEWNNLGFGRIRTDASPWAIRGGLMADNALELAGLCVRDRAGHDLYAGAYLTLLDTPAASILWCARPVGPVDSPEWSILENFLSDWRAEDLPSCPTLRQTPHGCRCLVTMRLDADEAVASARDLFTWYAGQKLPFSLAVKTSLPLGPADLTFLKDICASGGTLLSHSHTHPLNWGASYAEVLREASVSSARLAETDSSLPRLDLAVSPFHTNPPYALRALQRAGYRGFVGGIIHNDPEYLLGRAGLAPFAGGHLLGFSQQSMLHGDSYRRQGKKVEAHVQAFEAQYFSSGLFGYLDHPFSERYQYDWPSEKERLKAHQKLIGALRAKPGVWFWSQGQCFDFLQILSGLKLSVDRRGRVKAAGLPKNGPRPVCRWRGEDLVLGE
jgi:hypothetical protein